MQSFPEETMDNLLHDYIDKMPGIEGKLTEEMFSTIRLKASREEYSKSEQPTSQVLSPVGTRRMFQFFGSSENRYDIQGGYQSLKGTEGNFSADKDCVFLRPDSSSINDEAYMEHDFTPQEAGAIENTPGSHEISQIDDLLQKDPYMFAKDQQSEDYENYLQSSRNQKENNTEFKQQTNKTVMSGSGKTTSYAGGFLVLGHQDKMFPDQSRVTSQEEDE